MIIEPHYNFGFKSFTSKVLINGFESEPWTGEHNNITLYVLGNNYRNRTAVIPYSNIDRGGILSYKIEVLNEKKFENKNIMTEHYQVPRSRIK